MNIADERWQRWWMLAKAFDESKVKRGDNKNAGHFSSSGGGGSKSDAKTSPQKTERNKVDSLANAWRDIPSNAEGSKEAAEKANALVAKVKADPVVLEDDVFVGEIGSVLSELRPLEAKVLGEQLDKAIRASILDKAAVHPESIQRQEQEKMLANDKAIRMASLKGGINETYIVKLDSGLRGVWKPAAGEKYARDSIPDGTYYQREAAASQVAGILGLDDLVPATSVREAAGEVGSMQAYVADAESALEASNPWDGGEDLARAAAFDYLTGNTDRHAGNWLVKGDKLVLIDNGLSFPSNNDSEDNYDNVDIVRQAFGKKLPLPDTASWAGKWEAVEKTLKETGLDEQAIALTKQRFDNLVGASGKSFAELPGMKTGSASVANDFFLPNGEAGVTSDEG